MTGPDRAALDSAKTRVAEAVDRLADELERISHQIHANPELCFEEHKAAAWLGDFLARQAAAVERGVGGLPTAFRATIAGQGPGPTIAIMAEYDALTGLVNRRGLDRVLREAGESGEALGLLLLDLDGFKLINDRHGHQAGDDLLKQVATRLKGVVRPGDSVARLGGDEFALVVRGVEDAVALSEVADRAVLLRLGRVVAEGPAPILREDPRLAETMLGA